VLNLTHFFVSIGAELVQVSFVLIEMIYTWGMNKMTNNKQALQKLESLQYDLTQRLQKLSADLSKKHSADWAEQVTERK